MCTFVYSYYRGSIASTTGLETQEAWRWGLQDTMYMGALRDTKSIYSTLRLLLSHLSFFLAIFPWVNRAFHFYKSDTGGERNVGYRFISYAHRNYSLWDSGAAAGGQLGW